MFAYSLLLGTGLFLSSPWWVVRMITTRRYREGLGERLGRVPARVRRAVQGRQIVWVHAVSLGEVLAAARLVDDLESALNAGAGEIPWRVVVSTTTRTGQNLARERFGSERVFWFPVDFAWSVRAWVRVLQPRMVVLVESELWPRLLAECSRRKIPVTVVNARVSDRSYRRARRVRRLWKPVLRRVTAFLAQSHETAHRLESLGVPAGKVRVTGNLKYDAVPPETPVVHALRQLVGRRPTLIAGSLLDPEERLLLEQWPTVARAGGGVVLLLAPRHPERFEEVASQIADRFPLIRASTLLGEKAEAEQAGRHLQPLSVVLLDTVGDLAAVYSLADVAFVGGSLARKGGHNPLEPARLGVPVIMGPSFGNFREIVTSMQAAGGIEIVHDSAALSRVASRLLGDRVEADALGQRGHRVYLNESGATERTVAALLEIVAERPSTSPEVGV